MFDWSHPTMFAPMEGVTNPLLRELMAARGGIGMLCTEFVRIAGDKVSAKHMRRQVVKAPGVPLSVQVMGTHVDLMADAAGAIADAGANVVDINLGCPAPRVVRKGAGSAMLKDPELLYEVICAMRERVPGLLSAKIRAGFDESSGVVHIAQTVQRAGADFLVVHPRRRADFYQGVADWRIIQRLREALDIPVVGNGDVWYATDALRMLDETGCDAVMIGRPALRNPWIFEQLADLRAGREPIHPDGDDMVAWLTTIVTEYEKVFKRTAKRGPLGKIKEILTYVGKAIDDDGVFRGEALRAENPFHVVEIAQKRLAGLPSSRLDLAAEPTLGFQESGSTQSRTSLSA
jgi:tRNA-dihydrouridine synthase B